MPGKVFISHSHGDNVFCFSLLAALKKWGVDYWIDLEHLPPGDYISKEIEKAIRECETFLRVCTLAAMDSQYMTWERDTFFWLQDHDSLVNSGSPRKLIPLILADGYEGNRREKEIKYISMIGRPEFEWLEELREALGVESSTPSHATQSSQPQPVPPSPPRSSALQMMLSGMDAAIAAELRKVKLYGKTYFATDGQALGAVGESHLYSFQLDEPWEPQDDAPIRVVITEQQEVAASVVTSSGNKITIAVESRLPDSALSRVGLKDDPSGLLERLREALREAQEPATQLASKTFKLIPTHTALAPMPVPPTRFTPNQSQQQAITKALGNEVSYIIGPPGTGKTATLAAIAFALIRAGHSVLIAAHTNIAVDNAILKLAEYADGLDELREGRIVRFGPPQLTEIQKHQYIYPPNIAKRVGKELEAQKTGIQAARVTVISQLDALAASLNTENKGWREERTRLFSAVKNAQTELEPLQQQEQERVTRLQEQSRQALRAVDDAEDRFKLARKTHEHLVSEQTRLIGQRDKMLSAKTLVRARLMEAQRMNGFTRMVRRVNLRALNSQLADMDNEVWKVEASLKTLDQPLSAARNARTHAEQMRDQSHAYYRSLYDESCQPSPFVARIQELQQALQSNQRRIEEGNRIQQIKDEQQAPQRQGLQRELERLTTELADLDVQLRDLEKRVVAEAQVVATTLAKVYMGSTFKDRQFDAVIMDEVSIAPLPSVYIAATHAADRVVVIGDPKQLAPIVKAKDLIAMRWLGRDLFEVAGVTLEGADRGDARSALLDEQFRMNPAISIIARNYVYEHLLRDAREMGDSRRYEMYGNTLPLPGSPLVLCDTSDESPWQEKSQSGRRNMHHVMCSLSLAKQILKTLPPLSSTGNMQRVGIATPYRRQANELQKAIKAAKLTDYVRAGTVHKFQGLEFEVVIFDTVESRGVAPSEHFSHGGVGTQAMRLINVAVTRPQHKLVIIANLQWLRAKLSKSDILMRAVEEAAKAAVIDSREIVPL